MINFEAFLSTLPIMLYGLAGIFIVIIVIMLCVNLLTFLFPAKKKKKTRS